jgi:hypothetical protein
VSSVSTLTYSGQLTVLTCWCGMRHAVPEELRSHQLRQHNDGREVTGIYCPLGHSHVPAGEGEAERLRKQLEAARRSREATRELLEHEQRSHAATRGHLTRTKKRVAHGVCPCCNRSFANVERHMNTKHPDYVASLSEVL